MRTNGCTYGEDFACSAHGPRVSTEAYRKPGAALARSPSYTALGPRGVWMARAGWKHEKPKQPTYLLATLDACASRKVPPCNARGFIVRKAVRP